MSPFAGAGRCCLVRLLLLMMPAAAALILQLATADGGPAGPPGLGLGPERRQAARGRTGRRTCGDSTDGANLRCTAPAQVALYISGNPLVCGAWPAYITLSSHAARPPLLPQSSPATHISGVRRMTSTASMWAPACSSSVVAAAHSRGLGAGLLVFMCSASLLALWQTEAGGTWMLPLSGKQPALHRRPSL